MAIPVDPTLIVGIVVLLVLAAVGMSPVGLAGTDLIGWLQQLISVIFGDSNNKGQKSTSLENITDSTVSVELHEHHHYYPSEDGRPPISDGGKRNSPEDDS